LTGGPGRCVHGERAGRPPFLKGKTMERKRLTDVLNSAVLDQWNETQAAPEMNPLPRGEYSATLESGALFNAKSGTAGYKLCFTVIDDGDCRGRKVWHDVWLTPAALPIAKRDLAKLGITDPAQLEKPIPEGIVVKLRVAMRTGDDGREFNTVTRFDVVAVNPPVEPFAPTPTPADPDDDGHGDAFEPEADRLTTAPAPRFDFSAIGDASQNGPYGPGSDRL
jgi:hypothetical protein